MTPDSPRHPRRRRALMLAGAALIAGSSLAVPTAAFADVDDTGGAQRNESEKTSALRASITDGPAKNVILLIGDGMGDSEITIARNYQYGAAGELPGIDALPLTGQYTTYSLYKDGANKGKPDYVTDSAASGTGWATGTKSYNGAISVDINGTSHQTLTKIARANGLKTGDVSTAEIQDATPALQVEGASIDKRDHGADACGQIGETIDLDEAVTAALDFAKKDGNTLVIVTADHAHTSQIVDKTPPTSLSTGLKTADGTTMKVSYGTAGAGSSQQHTGAQLRIAAYGPGGANAVGLTDQTDNFFTMANALELNRDTGSLSAGAKLSFSSTAVKPGAELTATASGFGGDRQISGTVTSEPVALGVKDLITGEAGYTFTAPADEGTHTVTLTGAQSGTKVAAEFTVSASATPPAPPAPGAGAGGASDSAAGGSAIGDLASTGSVIAPYAALAMLLLAAGAALVIRRRRQHTA